MKLICRLKTHIVWNSLINTLLSVVMAVSKTAREFKKGFLGDFRRFQGIFRQVIPIKSAFQETLNTQRHTYMTGGRRLRRIYIVSGIGLKEGRYVPKSRATLV